MEEFLQGVQSRIESLIEQIRELNTLNPREEVNQELSGDVFLQILTNHQIDVVKYLCFSLLSGEYVKSNSISDDLTSVRVSLNLVLETADLLPLDIQSKVFEFQSNILVLIESYKTYSNEIKNYYSKERVEFLYTHNNEIDRLLESRRWEDQEVIDRTRYFFSLIQLSRIDHFPSNEGDYISGLLDVENSFNELNIPHYASITENIRVKINFLKHKWRGRKFSESPGDYFYSIDGRINTIIDFTGSNNKLNLWKDIIETQYELISKNWKSILERRVKPYKERSLNTLSLLELNQLIKYFKDVVQEENRLVNIINEINDRLQRETNDYNKYALGIIHNYALNNKFSLALDNNLDYNIVEAKYQDIIKIEQESIGNFFTIFKYLDYSCRHFTSLIEEENKILYIKKNESIIERLHKHEFQIYQEKMEWSLKHHNYVFILPYEECLVDTEGLAELPTIFYASSFVLPPSTIEIKKNYDKIKESFDNLKLYLKTGKYFSNETSKIESLTNEFDKKDFKSIEIISIFTALITFVLSSIPNYKFSNSVKESLLFMLCLSTSLSIFILLIFFTTRDLYKKWQGYLVIIVLFLLSGTGYYLLISIESKEKSTQKVKIENTSMGKFQK